MMLHSHNRVTECSRIYPISYPEPSASHNHVTCGQYPTLISYLVFIREFSAFVHVVAIAVINKKLL